MSFWSSNEVEPKRSYRWVGHINMIAGTEGQVSHRGDFGPKPFLVRSFKRPTLSFQNEKIINNFTSENAINLKHYIWEDVSVSIMDVEKEELNSSLQIYNWFVSLGYEPEQTTAKLSKLFTNLYDNKLNLNLQHIDHKGKPFEEWTFLKAQPTKVTFGGEASYDKDEPVIITLDFAYVAAQHKSIETEK